MEFNIDEILNELNHNEELREEIIYWLSDNGYLDDFKIRSDYSEY